MLDSLHHHCIESNGAHTSLVNTTSRIAYDTIIVQTNESIPPKEMHGLLLCTSNMIKLVEGFSECKFIWMQHLNECTLSSPPCRSKSGMKKYHISVTRSTSTKITGQDRENQHNSLCSHHSYNKFQILISR